MFVLCLPGGLGERHGASARDGAVRGPRSREALTSILSSFPCHRHNKTIATTKPPLLGVVQESLMEQ